MKKLDEITEVRETPRYSSGVNGAVFQGNEKVIVRQQVKSITPGKRFLHYLVDLAMLYAVQMGFGLVIGLTVGDIFAGMTELESRFFGYLIAIPSYGYYFVMEALFQQSLGKMLTQSVVVDEYGNKPTAYQVFIRTISRLVPFEAFSCLGSPSYGWHDKWAKTYVVTKSDLAEMKRRLNEENESDAAIYESMITDDSLTI